MIQFTSAGKRFGPKVLFEELDWMITPGDRVGLVGANGTGKSTLLKVLAGTESLDYGSVNRAKGMAAGYLPQDGLSLSGRTVFAECMSVFSRVQELEAEMHDLSSRMSEIDPHSPEYSKIAERYQQADGEFRARDGYAIEAQVGTVLGGLGFDRADWERRTEEFSGGWQMRIALAKLLLEKPNLLLLDEPTNHLDLETRNWLEDYLRSYPFAFVLISHDRYFLDVTVNRTAEIWNKRVHFYSGNYEKYLQQKQEGRLQREAAWRNQRDKIEQLEAFIHRFRYQATKAKQVQSRIKELERIERIEIPPEEKTIHFTFPQPQSSGRVIVECRDLSKDYGEKHVFAGVEFVIERGERVALVGHNGAGKSTLIRLLAGLEPPTGGQIRLGHNVDVDYFAQDQYKELDPGARMLDDIMSASPRSTQTELRNLLGCFLFSEDDVFKSIGVLSGGERNRYALARMLLHPSNFLLLDEPTNHLDLRAKDVLLEALQSFSGTVVFVSHDRYFIDRLATRVFEVGEGRILIYPGNYEDYMWRKEHGAPGSDPGGRSSADTDHGHSRAEAAAPVKVDGGTGNGRQQQPEKPAKQANEGRRNPIKERQMRQRHREVEEEIARLEAGITACETQLQHFVNAQTTIEQTELLGRYRQDLERLMQEWAQLSEQLAR